jgi:hypothetical protein
MAIPTNSRIYRSGTTPQTRSVVSSKNRIFAPAAEGNQLLQIGAMASFSPNESRNVEQVRGIGYGDMIAELVPGVTEAMTISVVRTALYLANVFQVFGYKSGTSGVVRSLRHHKFPFDIKHELILSSLTENATASGTKDLTISGQTVKALITIFEGCWMTSWSTEFTSDAAMVQENVEIIVTDVVDADSTYNEFIDAGLGGNDAYQSNIYKAI